MMKVKELLAVFGLFITLSVSAQDYFNHMDLGVNVSSMGIGADIAMPVGDYVRVRTGFTYMPRFSLRSNFGVDFTGNVTSDMMRRMKGVMTDLTGQEIQDNIDMRLRPSWAQFKFLVDIMPFRNNKHWNVTLGFFVGPSKIGEALNEPSGSTTLVGVNLYNNMYIKAFEGVDLFKWEDSNGVIHNIDADGLPDKLKETGMMGAPMGTFPDGTKAIMVPDKNNQVKAEMEVSKFRPYLGVGYTSTLTHDQRLKLAVDAGVLFWGGKPHVYVDNVYRISNDPDECPLVSWNWDRYNAGEEYPWDPVAPQRIDLTRDVTNIPGKVGTMVNTIKKFKCWPVISITLSYKLF